MNYVAVDAYCDNSGNTLLQKIDFGGATVTLGNIYGSNNDEIYFFIEPENNLKILGIVGGDLNATLDPRNIRSNIDTYNTAGIPSTRRYLWLNTMCANLKLSDPFRYFYPAKFEFTNIPFAVDATNRSRLDFFNI